MQKSTRTRANGKPPKPYPTFPLYAHSSGRWAKKVRGRTLFFGRWGKKDGQRIVPVEDVDASARAAKIEFDRQWPYISDGRTAPPATADADVLTVGKLVNEFLNYKRGSVDSGELALKTFQQYRDVCVKVTGFLGKHTDVEGLAPDQFLKLKAEFGKGQKGRLSPSSVGIGVRITKMLLKYAVDSGLMDRPIALGPGFKQPSKKAHRQHRQQRVDRHGKRMFEPHEIRAILDGAKVVQPDGSEEFVEGVGQPMRAMILLAANCGFGQSDLANLQKSHLDLDSGWFESPRKKTAADRRCPLWPTTVAAVREAIAMRPAAGSPEDEGCVFLTKQGHRFVRNSSGKKRTWVDSLGLQFGKVMKRYGLNGSRGFYAFRHGFETVAGESKDQMAVDLIMGHAGDDMARLYMEGMSDERLLTVTGIVHKWLFGKAVAK